MKFYQFFFWGGALALAAVASLIICSTPAGAQEDADALAKQLANPVAALISVPFQFNYDRGIGSADQGKRNTVNIQPVIPFELNDNWNIISRTILPVMSQDDISPGSGTQTGLGDTVQSIFFSPRPGSSGTIWAVGPVFLFPTATDDQLGTEKWGAGPTAVLLKQTGRWTYGGLVNHIESFAGKDSRADISSTFLNPFISRGFEGGWTVGTQLDHTIDNENDQDTGVWSVFVSKVFRIGNQDMSISLSPKYWYEDSNSSPEGFGIRANIILLFPR